MATPSSRQPVNTDVIRGGFSAPPRATAASVDGTNPTEELLRLSPRMARHDDRRPGRETFACSLVVATIARAAPQKWRVE
jgi:hypothetical protein